MNGKRTSVILNQEDQEKITWFISQSGKLKQSDVLRELIHLGIREKESQINQGKEEK